MLSGKKFFGQPVDSTGSISQNMMQGMEGYNQEMLNQQIQSQGITPENIPNQDQGEIYG
jgi:hypothetical protein